MDLLFLLKNFEVQKTRIFLFFFFKAIVSIKISRIFFFEGKGEDPLDRVG